MKYNILCIDPPWQSADKLTMSSAKRGAASNYKTMPIEQIKSIPLKNIAADDAILCLWVLGSQLQEGLDVMKAYGFRQVQTWIWVKTKKQPLKSLLNDIKKSYNYPSDWTKLCDLIINFDLNNTLNMFMGRSFRQTHEMCLIGVKGKIYKHIQNKSQRSVCFDIPKDQHSEKTELLQDRLDVMFPNAALKRAEIFARRDRPGWVCCGNECPSTLGEDVFDSIKRLESI